MAVFNMGGGIANKKIEAKANGTIKKDDTVVVGTSGAVNCDFERFGLSNMSQNIHFHKRIHSVEGLSVECSAGLSTDTARVYDALSCTSYGTIGLSGQGDRFVDATITQDKSQAYVCKTNSGRYEIVGYFYNKQVNGYRESGIVVDNEWIYSVRSFFLFRDGEHALCRNMENELLFLKATTKEPYYRWEAVRNVEVSPSFSDDEKGGEFICAKNEQVMVFTPSTPKTYAYIFYCHNRVANSIKHAHRVSLVEFGEVIGISDSGEYIFTYKNDNICIYEITVTENNVTYRLMQNLPAKITVGFDKIVQYKRDIYFTAGYENRVLILNYGKWKLWKFGNSEPSGFRFGNGTDYFRSRNKMRLFRPELNSPSTSFDVLVYNVELDLYLEASAWEYNKDLYIQNPIMLGKALSNASNGQSFTAEKLNDIKPIK